MQIASAVDHKLPLSFTRAIQLPTTIQSAST